VTDQRLVSKAADVLRVRAGFRPDPALRGRLSRCLTDAAQAEGLPVEAYVGALSNDAMAVQRLVDRVTIQESSFFRDEAQFDAFTRHVLPELPSSRIWSAGCANGQEAWSLAIALDEAGRSDCTVVATDISTAALARAQRGWYSNRELRGLSAERRRRYFRPCDRGVEIVPELRHLVTFAHHNLAQDAPPVASGTCLVAFCRNVLIYLTDDEITAVLDRIAGALGPQGHLFLGYSESLWRLPTRFALRRLGETFVYRVASRSDRSGTEPATTAREQTALPRMARPARDRVSHEVPEPTALPAASMAQQYLERGQESAAERDLANAVVAFRKAAYLSPQDPSIALHLAFALESLGDAAGARPWFRRALETMTTAEPMVSVVDGWSTTELTAVLQRKVSASGVDR
jgi:chemotaxis protein methyltransferase CheR